MVCGCGCEVAACFRNLVTATVCIIISLKVHKIENFFDCDFGICVISLLVMHK